jgi:hypothetical protein
VRTIDAIGLKYNLLTIISIVPNTNKKSRESRVLCLCDCGKTKIIRFNHIKNNKIRSCGCYGKTSHITHHMSYSSTYATWHGMKRRCYNNKSNSYSGYGGRGITVCDRWKNSFDNFLKDMGERPEALTIDRIDNDKGYSKENCRWATIEQQSRNTRRNKFFTIDGETKCLSDWCQIYDMPRDTIHRRVFDNGEDILSALTRRGLVRRKFNP